MAKAKKSVLQAMSEPVRNDEIRIEVSNNWTWARLIQLYNFIDYRGKTPKKIDVGIPLVTAKNIRKGYLDYTVADFISEDEYKERQSRGISQKGDILFTTEAPMGNVAIADLDTYSAGQRVITFQKYPQTDWVNNKFYYYYIMSEWFQLELQRQKTGSTVDGIKAEKLMRFPIPVPPINEQQRIVERIESLYAKLDEAKEKAQAVVDSFELRKSAILYRAFRGELTNQWRVENNISIGSWKQKSIESICHSLKYGTAKKSNKDGKVVVIRMGNLQQGEIDWSDLAYSSDEEDIEKYRLEAGDVLFNRTNSAVLVGKTSIYRGEYPAIYAGYLIKLDYDRDIVMGDYLNYSLNTNDAKEYCNAVKTDGVNQSNINAKKIGAYVIPVPSLAEQQQIVKIIRSMMEKEKKAKEAAEIVLDQIEIMKKSILARAFRGELGTNDPAEESALELLKSIL